MGSPKTVKSRKFKAESKLIAPTAESQKRKPKEKAKYSETDSLKQKA